MARLSRILSVTAMWCLSGCAARVDAPNIILILADDLGYEVLGANGGTSYETPNLDALARGGMRFTRCYATPLCTPSRVQLLTGKYSFRNYTGSGMLATSEHTFADELRDTGYSTAVVGKWQLYRGQQKGRRGSYPREAGFDEYCVWSLRGRGSRYRNPRIEVTGQPAESMAGAYGPDVFADYVEDFLERHRDERFFLYYPMVLAQAPFQPTPRHPHFAAFDPSVPGTKANDPDYFADNVAYMDALVGRLVRQLDELGLRQSTLLLYTADNGTSKLIESRIGDREVRGAKGMTTEAGTHVPLLASWPGTIAPGGVNDHLVDFTDFLPTLLEAAGIDLPDDGLDGLSFYPQLLGEVDTVREWVFCHDPGRYERSTPRRYVHDETWKLYDEGRFYHVADDPEERAPVADSLLATADRRKKAAFQTVLDRFSDGLVPGETDLE